MKKFKVGDATRAALIEAVSGPVIAVLFWIVVLLIVLMTLAHGKIFEANIFEAFGAIGQVVFAAAVFWLGKQQFDFTKQVAEHQARIDTYAIKKELLERFLTLYEISAKGERETRDTDLYESWYELADEVSRVFESDIDVKIVFLAECFDELHGDSEYMRELNEKFAGDLPGIQAALKENWRKIENLRYQIWFFLHHETTLGSRAIKLPTKDKHFSGGN